MSFELKTVVCFSQDKSLISRDLSLILQDEILFSRGGNLLFSSSVCNSSFVPCFLHCHSWLVLTSWLVLNFFANNQPNSVALKNTRFILDWFTEISVRIHYLIMMNKWSKLKFDNTYLTNSKWSLSFYKKWRYSTCNLGLCIEEYDFLYQFIGHAILILNFVPSTCLIGSWTKDIENLTHTRIIKNVRQHFTLKRKWRLAVWIVNRFIRQL